MKGGYVKVSPEELIRVCDICLNIHKVRDKADVRYKDVEYFCWKRLRKVKKVYSIEPTWTYRNAGIVKRLEGLKSSAKSVIEDKWVSDRDIALSLTTHKNLYMMLNKDRRFEPFIFGEGY